MQNNRGTLKAKGIKQTRLAFNFGKHINMVNP